MFIGLFLLKNQNILFEGRLISKRNIYQYDLQNETWYYVAGLDTSFIEFQDYDASYLGPDNKLYIGNFAGLSTQMSVINNPDIKGAGCNFCPRCLRLDTVGIAGTPPCMPNYSLGAQTCWPLGSTQLTVDSQQLVLYPNPVSHKLYIKTESKQKRELYNSVGQLLLSTKENEINVSKYRKGIYYIKVENSVKKVFIE